VTTATGAKQAGDASGAISIRNVSKTYDPLGLNLLAIDNCSVDIAADEFCVVVGPSGCGKTTLLNAIAGFHEITQGEILLDGEPICTPTYTASPGADRIVVFQNGALFPWSTVLNNVAYGPTVQGTASAREARKQAQTLLAELGLPDIGGRYPNELSSGMRRRVEIARALINDPRIILADEPTGNLDAKNEEIVLELLRESHQQGRTIVMVTHDPVVARLADRRIELHHGKIAAQEIFSMADEEQFDEILEELWVMEEHGERAELGRMDTHGVLPVNIAVEKMTELGLVTTSPHPPEAHQHKPFVNPCHDALRPEGIFVRDGSAVVALSPRGRTKAGSIIRRHRLAERLFTDSLAMDSESEIEQQACKFEHILSPGATDKICAFLGHPRTCPHGAPIPPGPCCPAGTRADESAIASGSRGVKVGR